MKKLYWILIHLVKELQFDESFLINPKKISANGTQMSLVTFIDDWLFDNLH